MESAAAAGWQEAGGTVRLGGVWVTESWCGCDGATTLNGRIREYGKDVDERKQTYEGVAWACGIPTREAWREGDHSCSEAV